MRAVVAALLLALLALAAAGPATSQTKAPKSGGTLNVMLREDPPQGFAIHEAATISVVWPASPCFNNLVYFDPLQRQETADTIIGELAEKWSWQDSNRSLVFFLRRDVRWHDGKPFTSADVKFTFDMVREARDAKGRLPLNPRKDWYANVEAIEAPDAHTVTFRLKRPQPSLLMMLASGYSPIYANHVPPARYRAGCVGTGPFKLKEWRRGEFVEYVKNPDYFMKGRPYLDGLRYVIVKERDARTAALQAGQLDVAMPGETTRTAAEQIKKAVPRIVVTRAATNLVDNVIMNTRKPPFDNTKVRLAVTYAIDRNALIERVHQGGGGALGGAMAPTPHGVWGMLDQDLSALPGYPTAVADMKARARALLAEGGFTPAKPLKVELATRSIAIYVDLANFLINELKAIGIEATLKQVESAQWHETATRGDYQIGANLTGVGPDDPDANLYENYGCRSARNYSFYCNDHIQSIIDAQSQELDAWKRREMVWSIQRKLEAVASRPVLAWRVDYFTVWPHVKNLVPHQSIFNVGRMQDVWRDDKR